MQKRTSDTLWMVCIFAITCYASNQSLNNPTTTISINDATVPIELIRHEKEFSNVRIEPALMGMDSGIEVSFEGIDDLHYYANPKTAPAGGFELKVEAKSDNFEFGKAVFPKWKIFTDPTGKKVQVFAGQFTTFIPIKAVKTSTNTSVITTNDIEIKISGLACTSIICLQPF